MNMRVWAAAAAVLLLAGCGGSSAANSAATVNGHSISMSQFNVEFHSERVQEADRVGYDACQARGLTAACDVIKKRSLNTLIDNELMTEYASLHHITVSPAEFQRQWSIVYQSRFGSRADVEHAWLRRTGETDAELKASLRTDLLQTKVMYAVTAGLPVTGPAIRVAYLVAASKTELKQVRYLLATHQTFLHVAAYLTHVSAKGCAASGTTCGDLGWVPYSLITPDRRALEAVPTGGIAGPYRQANGIYTQYGLYKVEARDMHYALTTKQLYTLRLQKFLIWLQHRQARAKVKRYIAA